MHRYAIALGSNRRHGSHGSPRAVLEAAMRALDATPIALIADAPVRETAPVGLAGRRFANSAILIETALHPAALLKHLKAIERSFGRRRGRRWASRVLDLDLLLWSGGSWRTRALRVPHPALVNRRFVLDPLAAIAPTWRIPDVGTVRQVRARLTRAVPVHRSGSRSGP